MAIYYARANGNVNAANVWSTTAAGATSDLFPSFTSSDTLMANSFTVTLNVNTTVLEVRNDTANGATANGSFALTNGVTLTANVVVGTGSTTNCVTFNFASPNTSSIVGNLSSSSNAQQAPVVNGSTGTLNITGNCTGGPTNLVNGINNNTTGTINITGICTGGNNNAHGAYNVAGGTINIIGTVIGGTATNSFGAQNVGVGTINIVGTAIGSSVAIGANNSSTGTLTVTRAKGNGFGNGSVGITSAVGVSASQNSLTRVYEIEYGDLGQSPTSGPVFLFPASSNVALFYRFGTSKKTLVDSSSSSGLLPSQADVRNGVFYNAGTNIGSMNVPSAVSVAAGVGVDNTTGTAILTTNNLVDIWNVPISGISVSNSIGERLKNCSTVASMGQQLAAALSNIS